MCIHIYFKGMKSSCIVYCPGHPLICTQGEDRPLVRWLVTSFTLQRHWSDTKVVHVGVHSGQTGTETVLSQSSCFPGNFHSTTFHTYISIIWSWNHGSDSHHSTKELGLNPSKE